MRKNFETQARIVHNTQQSSNLKVLQKKLQEAEIWFVL